MLKTDDCSNSIFKLRQSKQNRATNVIWVLSVANEIGQNLGRSGLQNPIT